MEKLRHRLRRRKQAPEGAITNQTVAEHREEVLKRARKFKYPLQHSKHRVLIISTFLTVLAIGGFVLYAGFLLYRQQSTSAFGYNITKLAPFPVARLDGDLVPYEQYLFELRHYLYYKRTQENLDFNSPEGKSQYEGIKQLTLQKVLRDEYVRKLAKQNGVTVNKHDIDVAVTQLRGQQVISDNKTFEGVLRSFYDWSEADLRRVLYQQLLRQKILAVIDKDKVAKAESVLQQIKAGADFGETAKANSDDADTKANGGVIDKTITRSSRDFTAAQLETIYSLQVNQVSDVTETPRGLEIMKVLESDGQKVKIAHILIAYRDLDQYLDQQLTTKKLTKYIKI